jgi:hypothetical protein
MWKVEPMEVLTGIMGLLRGVVEGMRMERVDWRGKGNRVYFGPALIRGSPSGGREATTR